MRLNLRISTERSEKQIPLPVQGEGKRAWRARVRAASTQSRFKLKMMGTQTEVVIRRDAMLHRWVIVNGAHHSQTPWSDNADAISVVTWIKSKANGPVKVSVDLGH
jgi:hypothetical protein